MGLLSWVEIMERRDPSVFGRNVRAFRTLRGWSIRDLAERANVSTKTIVKIERGEGCTIRIEQKIALGFAAYVGRLWDASLLSDQPQRIIRREDGRWFFAAVEDAELFHRRIVKSQSDTSEDRLRSDPDEIQNEAERHRLGHAGLSRGFVKTMGGGLSSGYYQYNQAESFSRDYTPADGLGYTYICHCARGSLRFHIRGEENELREGDSIVFEGDDTYWVEPWEPVAAAEKPPLLHLICLGILTLPKPKPG
jgi:transcriptional regulator with XRE-family HTH domain